MSVTEHYGLYITDDSSERFLDWRDKMNGTTNSNMIIIDEALGSKADSSVAVGATLLSSAWTGAYAPFTQELSVAGLTEGHNGVISVAHNATVIQREAAREAMLSVLAQEDGELTIVADGEMPEIDIPVAIIIYG